MWLTHCHIVRSIIHIGNSYFDSPNGQIERLSEYDWKAECVSQLAALWLGPLKNRSLTLHAGAVFAEPDGRIQRWRFQHALRQLGGIPG